MSNFIAGVFANKLASRISITNDTYYILSIVIISYAFCLSIYYGLCTIQLRCHHINSGDFCCPDQFRCNGRQPVVRSPGQGCDTAAGTVRTPSGDDMARLCCDVTRCRTLRIARTRAALPSNPGRLCRTGAVPDDAGAITGHRANTGGYHLQQGGRLAGARGRARVAVWPTMPGAFT